MPGSGIDLEQTPVSPSEAQAALEAVLHSPQFERSERLQRFLKFICDLTLQGESQRINEYLIGSEVFQRGSDYSPSEDSIVRRQAHALRQKIHEYYTNAGRDDAVRIELPVGRYVPVFRRATAHATLPAVTAPPDPETASALDTTSTHQPPNAPQPPPHVRRVPVAAIAVATLLLGAALGYLLRPIAPVRTATPARPATEAIWSPWFQPGSDAVICFSNPQTAVIKHFPKALSPDTQPVRYRFHPQDEARIAESFHLPKGEVIYYSPATNQTKVGEAIAGVHLAGLLARYNVNTRTTQSRFLSWDDLRKQNMILMGHSEANQWLEPLLKDYPFRLSVTTDEHPRGIINHQPQTGELPEYKIAYSQTESDADREYALISMIPGVDASHRLLLINGLNSQATQIATEFITAESSLTQLLDRLKQAAPNHTGPWHFQAVLRTEVYDKVPVRASLETVRVLPNTQPAP